MTLHSDPTEDAEGVEVATPAATPNPVVRTWAWIRGFVRRNRTESIVMGIAIVVAASALIPSPYAIERPGVVVDVLGTVPLDGEDVAVLSVEGETNSETGNEENAGALNLLTVSIVGSPQKPLGWLSLVPALFDPAQTIAPAALYYPEGVTVEQREEFNSQQMDASQVQAAAAAFQAIGEPVGVTLEVAGVDENGPASGVLEIGDQINSVDGVPLTGFQHLITAVSDADGPIELEVRREGKIRIERITPKPPTPGAAPRLGVGISTTYDLPREVDISVPHIGGPSAGLIFGLAIMDRVGAGPDLAGLTVSGTGTLNDAGDVGPIGGLTQKAWAAERAGSDLFLMPVENCADVDGFPKDLTVAPVATLEEAESVISAVAAGGGAPGLERCQVTN